MAVVWGLSYILELMAAAAAPAGETASEAAAKVVRVPAAKVAVVAAAHVMEHPTGHVMHMHAIHMRMVMDMSTMVSSERKPEQASEQCQQYDDDYQ